MENKEYQLQQLRILQKYMPEVRMIPDLIDRMENKGLKELLPKQINTLESLIAKSSKKKEIAEALSGKQVTSKPVNTSNESTNYFKTSLVKHLEERVPIGFKIIPTNTKSFESRYRIDTSVEARMKRFDELFN